MQVTDFNLKRSYKTKNVRITFNFPVKQDNIYILYASCILFHPLQLQLYKAILTLTYNRFPFENQTTRLLFSKITFSNQITLYIYTIIQENQINTLRNDLNAIESFLSNISLKFFGKTPYFTFSSLVGKDSINFVVILGAMYNKDNRNMIKCSNEVICLIQQNSQL